MNTMLVLFFIIIIIVKKIITVEDAQKECLKKFRQERKLSLSHVCGIQDSPRFWILRCGSLQVSVTGFQSLSVDSGFQSLVGFQIP